MAAYYTCPAYCTGRTLPERGRPSSILPRGGTTGGPKVGRVRPKPCRRRRVRSRSPFSCFDDAYHAFIGSRLAENNTFLFPTVDLWLLGQLAPKELYGPLLLKLRICYVRKLPHFVTTQNGANCSQIPGFHNPHWLRTKPGFILQRPTYVGAIVDGRAVAGDDVPTRER